MNVNAVHTQPTTERACTGWGVGSEDENTGAGGSHSWVNSVGDDIMLQVIGRLNMLTHM